MLRNKHQIKQDIDMMHDMKSLSEVYEEISVMKMQRVRGGVLSTRTFLEALAEVYYDVKVNYEKEIERAQKHKRGPSQFMKNGKTVSLLLTSNAKLYGEIIPKIFNLFIENYEKEKTDVVIIGRYGKDLFDAAKKDSEYKFYDFPDNDVTLSNILPVVGYILHYEKVYVYYGRFANVITQTPVKTTLSGENIFKDLENQIQYQEKNPDEDKKIIFGFEPSLEGILGFFEAQILYSLFHQTVSETQLSREGSRVLAMERALSNIEREENVLKKQQLHLAKVIDNKKQLESLSGMSLWRK